MQISVIINKDQSGRLTHTFPFNSAATEKIRMIQGRRWHPLEKYWSFPDNQETLALLLDIFAGKEVSVDHLLQSEVVIAPTLAKGGEGGFSNESTLHAFLITLSRTFVIVLPRICLRVAHICGIFRNYRGTPAARQQKSIRM